MFHWMMFLTNWFRVFILFVHIYCSYFCKKKLLKKIEKYEKKQKKEKKKKDC